MRTTSRRWFLGGLAGIAAAARLLAERIPNAKITIYPTGVHIWLGHDEDVAERIAGFVREASTASVAGQNP